MCPVRGALVLVPFALFLFLPVSPTSTYVSMIRIHWIGARARVCVCVWCVVSPFFYYRLLCLRCGDVGCGVDGKEQRCRIASNGDLYHS